ncbi:MAG: NYN domain-containing protein [Deltaproteobacteria bacterium]|nr:NYN domain-containing protein [Deltaproteobacteria bacterium]
MLLIDGHNLIGRVPGFSLSDEEAGREAVLRRIGASKAAGSGQVIVFFDGDRPGGAREERFGGVRVVYPAAGRSADEEILRRLGAGNPRGSTVVTSDGGLAARARALGAAVESCEAFWARIQRRPRGPAPEKPETDPGEVERWLEEFAKRGKKRQ